jgi:hypothetical protein
MTTVSFDDPARTAVAERALEARCALGFARTLMAKAGYQQIRIDQYQHPDRKTMVETGYAYGETRLVVHISRGGSFEYPPTDLRLVGGESQNQRMKTFENLISV